MIAILSVELVARCLLLPTRVVQDCLEVQVQVFKTASSTGDCQSYEED